MINRDLRNALLTAFAVVIVLFPDALFLRAGLSQTSQFMGAFVNTPTKQFYKQPPHRRNQHGYADGGGALWQSEPAQQFLNICLSKKESPYWNPYSGAGQLGPETLVDLKLSFQGLLVALLGGSQKVFDGVQIATTFTATAFIYLFFARFLKLSTIACVAGSFIFAFNGYCVATQGSNTSQTYYYFPILLYVLSAFSRKPTAIKYLWLFLVDATILSTTFMPTTFFVLFTTHLVALAVSLEQGKDANQSGWKRPLSVLGIQVTAGALAFLFMCFVYLPILESFQYVDAVSMYSARVFYSANFYSYLSLFTPKHFWEEYGACPGILWSEAPANHGVRITSNMYHFGAIAFMIVLCAFNRKRMSPVAAVCLTMLVISLGRIFGVPGIAQLVEFTPGFRSLGEQYWFVSTAICFTVASGLGMQAILDRKAKAWLLPVILSATIFGTIAYLASTYGFPAPDADYKRLCVLYFTGLTAAGITIILLAFKFKTFTPALCWLLIINCTGELVNDMMFSRSRRYEFYKQPPPAVKFLKENSGHHRVANLGMGVLPAEEGSAFGIQQIETMNMNILPTYEGFFHKHFLKDRMTNWGRFCTFFLFNETKHFVDKVPLNLAMMNLCGVKYLVAMPFSKSADYLKKNGCVDVFGFLFWHIYESKDVYPRAFLTSHISAKPELMGENTDDCARSIAFTSDKELLAECRKLQIIEIGNNADAVGKLADESASIKEYHHAKVVVETNAEQPAVMVLTDNWHPNWSATLDGKPTHLGLVDETFRGVAVPPGKHEIVMNYRPKTLTAGLMLSGAALLCALVILLMRKRIDAKLSRLAADG